MKRRRLLTCLIASSLLGGHVARVFAGGVQQSENFEGSSKGWFFAGGSGFDHGKGLAHAGVGNGWVRNSTGWNALNSWISVPTRSECQVDAWLRLSPALTDGYISVRNDKESRPDRNFDVIREIKLIGPGPSNPGNAGYNHYNFEFNSGDNPRVLFYVGLWGNGRDSWIQIDDWSLFCKAPYSS